MAKATLTVTLPDDTTAKRQTVNSYTHVVALCVVKDGVSSWSAIQWCKSERNALKAVKSSWWSKCLGETLTGELWAEFRVIAI